MRIRSIRPEFWSSQDIASLPWDYRLIFVGLWSYVDDNGVGRDDDRLIRADLFPLDDDQAGALRKIHGALSEYSSRGLITRYTVDGKPYLHVTTFSNHQVINRPSKGRYPLPTCGNAVIHDTLTEPSVSPHANAPLGEGEKGRRGEGEKDVRPAEPDEFDAWWSVYPRKDGKQAARKAFRAAVKAIGGHQQLIDATTAWFGQRNLERRFMPMPATWLNGRRWEDEAPAKPTHAPTEPRSRWDTLPNITEERLRRERERGGDGAA